MSESGWWVDGWWNDPEHNTPSSGPTTNRDREIVERIRSRESPCDVAEDLGMAYSHVTYICRKAGVSLKDLRKQKIQTRNREIVARVRTGGNPDRCGQSLWLVAEQNE